MPSTESVVTVVSDVPATPTVHGDEFGVTNRSVDASPQTAESDSTRAARATVVVPAEDTSVSGNEPTSDAAGNCGKRITPTASLSAGMTSKRPTSFTHPASVLAAEASVCAVVPAVSVRAASGRLHAATATTPRKRSRPAVIRCATALICRQRALRQSRGVSLLPLTSVALSLVDIDTPQQKRTDDEE